MSQPSLESPELTPSPVLLEPSHIVPHGAKPVPPPATAESVAEHGPEIEEIISNRMPAIVRWGTLIFTGMLAVLTTVCWFIQYPDLVIASGQLSSVNAPRKVVTKIEGRLMRIVVRENQLVTSGQLLGYMESTASRDAVTAIDALVDTVTCVLRDGRADEALRYFPAVSSPQDGTKLGELQPSYQIFAESFMQFKAGLHKGLLRQKLTMLETDLQTILRMNTILQQQKSLLLQDLALSNKTYAANKELADNKVIASFDLRNEQSKLIAKQLSMPQIDASIVSNETSLNQKKKEIVELENQINNQQYTFVQALRTIKSQIQTWQTQYLLRAPVAGTVSFTGFFQENQEMKSGRTLFYVQPHNSKYFAEVTIPQYNFGKVRIGQHVALKFQAYSYAQYGVVLGQVQYIDPNPSEKGYLAKVSLPQGLVTNRGLPLRFQQGLAVQADIVTENMRLLERFYYDLLKGLRR